MIILKRIVLVINNLLTPLGFKISLFMDFPSKIKSDVQYSCVCLPEFMFPYEFYNILVPGNIMATKP